MGFSNPLVGRTLTAEIAGNVPVLNATGTSLTTTDAIDELFNSAVALPFVGGLASTGPFTPAFGHAYQTIAVQLPTGGASSIGMAVCVFNLTNLLRSGWQYQRIDPTEFVGPMYFAVPVNAGDTIQVDVMQTWGALASPQVVDVLGLGSVVSPATLRSDGRSLPQHSLHAQASQGAVGSVNLIAAPAGGLRILVGSLFLISAGASIPQINATVDTLTAVELFVAGETQAPRDYAQGLLCDPGTALTLQQNAAVSCGALASYDIVPA